MAQEILWLDNDTAYIDVYRKTLVDEGYAVVIVPSVSEAEAELARRTFQLLILDIMIPTTDESEEERYPPAETNHGLKTGLVFYQMHRTALEEKGTRVLVLTARIDTPIKQKLMAKGLPAASIIEKAEVARVDDFLARVHAVLEN